MLPSLPRHLQATRLTLVQLLINSRGLNMNPLQSLYYVSPACLLGLAIPFGESFGAVVAQEARGQGGWGGGGGMEAGQCWRPAYVSVYPLPRLSMPTTSEPVPAAIHTDHAGSWAGRARGFGGKSQECGMGAPQAGGGV